MKRLLLLCFLGSLQFIQAQNILPLGAWRSHLPERGGDFVTQSETQLFYATTASIMVLEKDELSPKFITKVDGLSETSIRMVKYHEASETLIIVYESSVIDLYRNGDILTVPAIRNFTSITGEKNINDIYIYDDETVFLAGSFGVSSLRLDNGILPVTTFTGGANVRSVAVFEGFLYAGTEEGIYRISVNDPNLEDFTNWQLLDESEGFPADYSTNALVNYKDKLYFGINEDIYRLEDGAPVLFADQTDNYGLQYMTAEGNYLLAGFRCVGGDCGNGQGLYFEEDGSGGQLAPGCIGVTNTAIEDETGRIWFGDAWRLFRHVNNVTDQYCNTFDFESPYSEFIWDIAVEDDVLWYASGALNENLSPIFMDHGFSSFIEGEWTAYNRWTNDVMKGENPDPNARADDIFTVIEVAINPVTQKVYAGSFLSGLIEWKKDEELFIHHKNNSPLQGATGDSGRTRVSGLTVDEDGNLWISNQNANEGKPIHRISPDNEWMSFSASCNQDNLFQIAIDRNSYKWFVIGGSTAGVLVFDEGDITDSSDDRCRVFNSSNSNLPTNETNCVAVDQDGDVWVGTAAGIVIFECGGSAFENNCQGSLRIVERDGFNEHLFKTQTVKAIAVDGANRKWVGTTNGVYLVSPDGEEELLHFTETNSPLFDNNIRDIDINQKTGEVFFATNKGLISYQGDAIEGNNFNNQNVLVFPNPVRPDYHGPITVRGLARDANVKITDVNGKLVYETQALGGQVIWDGQDYNGRRVQTGVYLFFSTTNPSVVGIGNPDVVVAKVVFIN